MGVILRDKEGEDLEGECVIKRTLKSTEEKELIHDAQE